MGDRGSSEGGVVALYSYWRSSCSYRVRIALAHKGIAYEYRPVNLIRDGGEQHKEDYARLNPLEVVPTILIDGTAIGQSVAILEYLEETRPERPLLPKDAVPRAQVRQLVMIICADTQPAQNLLVLKEVGEERKNDWARKFITRGLQAYEKLAQQTAGKYSVGDEVTLADVALVPQLYNAHRFDVDLSSFTTILRIEEALQQLSAFRAAHPDAQPDAQRS